MNISILVVLNDMPCSKMAVEFLAQMPVAHSEIQVTLLHVFRKPTGSEEMMGKKFMQAQEEKINAAMSSARTQLIDAGYSPDNIRMHITTQPYPTVADGIIVEAKKGNYGIVVMGRRKMSKPEEFVLGDPSIKVIRALDKTAVIVVKC